MMIRKMKESDLPEILVIETECFHDAWNKDHYIYELKENPYSNLWVMVNEENDEIVGYYDLWLIFEHAEIANIGIRPKYQGKGYGSKLMAHLENEAMNNECETISLEVRVSNEKAIRLYERYDFSVINIKPGYYKDDNGFEDAYYMMKGI